MTEPSDPTRPTDSPSQPVSREPSAAPAAPTPRAEQPPTATPTSDSTTSSTRRPAPDPAPEPAKRGGGPTAALWISLILGAIILVLLLIFVIQNNVPASFEYFGAQFSLPLGVAMLLAAIAGALVMGLVGSVRIMQLSLSVRRLRKEQAKVRSAVSS